MARKRWMDEMIKAAKTEKVDLPWTRGARRAAMMARRTIPEKTSAAG
jgi:hypothetical protein